METKAGLRRELRLVCVFGTAARISAFQITPHALPTSLSLSQPLLPFNPLFQALSSAFPPSQRRREKRAFTQFRIEIRFSFVCISRLVFFERFSLSLFFFFHFNDSGIGCGERSHTLTIATFQIKMESLAALTLAAGLLSGMLDVQKYCLDRSSG